MPLLGAHKSIAGGYHHALLEAQDDECDTVQMFLTSPRMWPMKPPPPGRLVSRSDKIPTKNGSQWCHKELDEADVRTFKRTLRQTRLRLPMAHACYLINLASPDSALHRKSLEATIIELQRAEALGLRYLVIHPGSTVDGDEEGGLGRVARALDEMHARCAGYRVQILLETTAGQGTSVGHRFEHLARILSLVAEPGRLGVCLDTCHVFAAGYALYPEKEYRATFWEFDRLIGIRRLRAFHVNDSLKPCGSRVDRHAHIGKGCIGLEAFRTLVNDPRFRNRPMVLETPKESDDCDDMDPLNLQTLRGLQAANKEKEASQP